MPETQNIYDDARFFAAYGTLLRSQQGLVGAPEWPVLRDMILSGASDLQGTRVLDLGCGYGWFSRWARDNRASSIKGVDVSENMISRAKEFDRQPSGRTSAGTIEYQLDDIETITLDNGPERHSYGLVYSSLTFHYIEDLGRLFRQIHTCLQDNGRLVFSVEHPICTAPIQPGPDWTVVREGDQERKIWPLNHYSDEGLRTTSWLGMDGVRKYHRTVESYISLLLENGFAVTGLKDWVPSKPDVEEHPEWKDERHRPYFLLISAAVRPRLST